MTKLQNPIPSEVADSDELKKVFAQYDLVPYAGTTLNSGDTLLWWYIALSKLSPTWGTCINKIGHYAFGTRMKLEYTKDPNFDTGMDVKPVSPADSTRYFTEFGSIFNKYQGGTWADWFKLIQHSRKTTGNVFVELTFAEVNGQYSATVRFHPTVNCKYKNTVPGTPKIVAVSPCWDLEYLNRKPPALIPKYPQWVEQNGVRRTMFHLKNGTNEWYGRPESDFTDMSKYQEAQNSMYLIIQAQNQYVGSLILEAEDGAGAGEAFIDDDGARKAGYESFIDQFEKNHTMKGDDPSAFMVFARPIGSRPMFVFQVQPNTNENWHKIMGEIKRDEIMRGEGCTPSFLGIQTSTGFQSEPFVDDYVFNMEPVIYNNRETETNFINGIISEVWKLTNRTELDQFSVTFGSPIDMQLAEYKQRKQVTTNPISNGNSQADNNGNGSIAV